MLLKVEGEKNYHLRIAAILGDVEAEVSCSFPTQFSHVPVGKLEFHLYSISLFLGMLLLLDGLREAAQRVCSSCDSIREFLTESSVFLGRSKFLSFFKGMLLNCFEMKMFCLT